MSPLPLLALLLAPAFLATPLPAQDQGRLVIIGGGLSRANEAVYRAVLDGVVGGGPLCVIPTASATPERSMRGQVDRFEEHGGAGVAVGVPLSVDEPDAAHDPEVVARLSACGGFYFTGGVQSRITRLLRPGGASTPALDAIRARHRAGALVAGSSAGAAIMSDPMIAGGSSARALERGVIGGGVSVAPGLGFFTGLTDQHFLARGRIGRLLVAVLQLEGTRLGFGIDENTALVVEGGKARVVGASGVVVVDAREARRDPAGHGGTGLRVTLLGAGDVLDLSTRRVAWDPAKQPLPVSSEPIAPVGDVFERWRFLHLLHELGRAGASAGAVSVPAGDYEVVIRKAPGFTAVAGEGEGEGVRETPAGLGVGPLRVDIRRVRGSRAPGRPPP
ncbi:MAG TPA: cyanophycinase [Longimicrobiales bacterium]|nr:cyanophycinase [Longimicrobiales bacterium]